jgi:hypothetical protein
MISALASSIQFKSMLDGSVRTNLKADDLGALQNFISQTFGNSKVTVIEDYPDAYQDCKFASLEKGSLKDLVDEELRHLAAIVVKKINDEKAKLPKSEGDKKDEHLPWSTLTKILDSMVFLTADVDKDLHKSDFVKWSFNGAKFDGGGADPELKLKAHTMLSNLVNDERLYENLKINKEKLFSVFAESGTDVKGIEDLMVGSKHILVKAVDISICRLPEPDRPMLELNRLRVYSAQNCERVLFMHKQDNYITAEFTSRKYLAKSDLLKQLNGDQKKSMDEFVSGLGF